MLVALAIQSRNSPETTQQRTVIQLVNPPRPEPQPSYEIDQPPLTPEQPLEVESPRRAEQDRQVQREQAPQGEDVRDRRQPASPPLPSSEPAPPQPLPVPSRPAVATPLPSHQPQPKAPDVQESVSPLNMTTAMEEPAPPRLTREQLFPTPDRLADIVENQQAEQDRIRKRDDVEIGDEIWLNLQHDRLVSFFRRFHDRVERVWNYPPEAALNGIDGTLELLIIVSKDGDLIDVDLRRTSGSDLLDFEAIQAVYRAAPFGPLGRHYPHDQLRIRAYFQYQLGNRYIFGRQ